MTQVLSPTPEALALASQLLHDGQLVAFPTETVYGLGANALDAKAVLNIFAAKGRPADNPLIVHVYDRAQLTPLCEVSPLAEKLMDAFWPGPLTLILPEARGVAANLIPEEGTLGIRIADHEFCKRLIRKLRKPLVSTSANITGQPTPATFSEISKEIVDGVDLVIDPQFDEHPTHKASSILMVGIDGEIKIIRA